MGEGDWVCVMRGRSSAVYCVVAAVIDCFGRWGVGNGR